MVRASLIWLNYNSSSFIDIALRSIESALSLDFDDYEVIVVDNASGDGSFEVIRKLVEGRKPSSVRVKFVRSDANGGYAGLGGKRPRDQVRCLPKQRPNSRAYMRQLRIARRLVGYRLLSLINR